MTCFVCSNYFLEATERERVNSADRILTTKISIDSNLHLLPDETQTESYLFKESNIVTGTKSHFFKIEGQEHHSSASLQNN